jgi:hypothetical protein
MGTASEGLRENQTNELGRFEEYETWPFLGGSQVSNARPGAPIAFPEGIGFGIQSFGIQKGVRCPRVPQRERTVGVGWDAFTSISAVVPFVLALLRVGFVSDQLGAGLALAHSSEKGVREAGQDFRTFLVGKMPGARQELELHPVKALA